VQFSRDPLNLVNKHSRKYEGYCNDQAIGINADANTVAMVTKLPKQKNKPAKMYVRTQNKQQMHKTCPQGKIDWTQDVY